MTTVSVSKNARLAVEIAQWVRNGKPVVADLQNRLAEQLGHAVYARQRCVFRSFGGLVTTGGTSMIPDSLATRSRWRHAWHSHPYASFLYVQFEIAPENVGGPTDPYCTLDVNEAASGTLIGTATMHWGSSSGAYADVPVNFGGGQTSLYDTSGAFVFLTPDIDYQAVFKDIGTARLHSAAVWEVALTPTTEHGYPDNTKGAGSPIYDKDRYDPIVMARQSFARGRPQLWNWHSDYDGVARTQGLAGLAGTLSKSLDAFTLAGVGASSATTPTFVAVTSMQVAKGVDLTVSWPSHTTGDIGLLIVGTSGTSVTLSDAEGFAFKVASSCSGTDMVLYAFWCRATSGSMTAPTIAASGCLIATMMTIRGCVAAGDPVDVSAGVNYTGGNTTSIQYSRVTTTVANTLVVYGAYYGSQPTDVANAMSTWDTATQRSDETANVGLPFGGGPALALPVYKGLTLATAAQAAAGLTPAISPLTVEAALNDAVTLAFKP